MEIFTKPMTYPTAGAMPLTIRTFTVDTTGAATGPGWSGVTTVYVGPYEAQGPTKAAE